MNIEQARRNMIDRQICVGGNVHSQEVLDLLAGVRRECFVPPAYAAFAFADIEIPLPCGENMLTPMTEARLLQAIAPRQHERVLEIGTGSGYMAALLAHRARHVTTIEIEPSLQAFAQNNLAAYGVANVEVTLGDGAQGWGTAEAAYDVIVLSGALPVLPEAFLRQIKVGGRIAAFLGDAPLMRAQIITRIAETGYAAVTLFESCIQPLREATKLSRFRF